MTKTNFKRMTLFTIGILLIETISLFYFLPGNDPLPAYLAFFIGVHSVQLYYEYKEQKRKQSYVMISGESYSYVQYMAMQYIIAGMYVVRQFSRRKYYFFGKTYHHVHLAASPGLDPSQAPEPTDQELEEQERFEELAERQKKRNSENPNNPLRQ